ncbi:MAG: aminotransferase class I/II-fold pyridoxal phosphate-dependent enzyme [Myxococcales bacterium]|jgi:7-keto-8-aminopelargonate synthetase-like enzyme
MRRASDYLDVVDAVVSDGCNRGVVFRTIDDGPIDGRTISLDGRRLLHFGSCSYVGLELDPRLCEGMARAAARYGSQFASSRPYLSIPLYQEFEGLLEQLFGLPVLTTQTMTLAHAATLPVLIDEKDAVLLDQHVHNSVQMAVNHVRVLGTTVEVVRHNRLDLLAERIEELRIKHRRVWYLADGVYSMAGDLAPIDGLVGLLDKYEQFHAYVDDAHGTSWIGKHGRGWPLSRGPLHPRMVVTASLCKAFAAAGAAILVSDPELRRRMRNVGPTLLFSGPIWPPMLGAAIASARIHLSDEIEERTAALLERVRLFNELIGQTGLPLISRAETPIRCVAVGVPRVAYSVVARLKEEGFYTNPAVFPAVPKGRAGIRMTLTPHQTLDDVRALVSTLQRVFPEVIEADGFSLDRARRGLRSGNVWAGASRAATGLSLQHEESVTRFDREEWNRLLGREVSSSYDALLPLEATFRGNPQAHDNWRFHYFVVRDRSGKPVLATFFTDAIWKDDMLSPTAVSVRVEERRRDNPMYLTSRTLAMGTLLTEGNHLYLDRSADWRKAMLLLLEAVGAEQVRCRATNLVLRDFESEDVEMDGFLTEQGFLRFALPESYVLDLGWKDEAEWLAGLSRKARSLVHEAIERSGSYEVEILRHGGREPSNAELEHLFWLYRNVKAKAIAINTFEMPSQFLRHVLAVPGWELMLLRLKPSSGGDPEGRPVAMAVNNTSREHYVGLMAGIDYRFVPEHGAYRQLLLQVVRRAHAHGAKKLHLGIGAKGEKRRLGAAPRLANIYAMSADSYHSDLLVQLMSDRAAA